MLKLRTLGLCAAAAVLCAALPGLALAHDSHDGDRHGGGWHGHHGHGHGHEHGYWHAPAFAAYVPVPIPIAYGPPPLYVAAPCPPRVYQEPVYYPPTWYGPAPVISVRTRNVAVSIGGFFPY